MKLPKFNRYWLEIIFILLVGLVPLLWFKDGYLAAGHDMSYPLAPIDFWLDRLFVWTDRIGSFGSNQTDAIPGIFIHGLQALFYYVTGSLQLAQKLDFIFWFTLPGITMYILLRSLHPKKEEYIIRISGALFYMLNHYLLQGWIIAEMSKFSIVAAIPLIVLFTVNVMHKGESIVKNSFLVGFTLFFLNGGAGIPLWGGLAIVWITTLGVLFRLNPQPIWYRLRRGLTFVFLSVLTIGILNWYWIYPYVQSFSQNYTTRVASSGGNEGAVRWSQEISKNASFNNLIKLQGIPDWYDNPQHPYSNNFLDNYFLLLLAIFFPAVAFVSLYTKKGESKHNVTFKLVFLAILLVAIPFTAGSHPPTGILYDLALKYIPGFSIFRTPFYKFGMALWFAYSYLIAIGLKQLADLVKQNLLPKLSFKIISASVLFIFTVLLCIYNYPAFLGEFFNWSKKYSTLVRVPNYIFEAKKELDSNNFSTRTLMLPQLNDGNKYIAYAWKYFSLSSVPSMLTRKPVLLNDAALFENEPGLVNSIYQQMATMPHSTLLEYVGVDRVIIQEDFKLDEGMDYSMSLTKNAIYRNPEFLFNKQIGKWKFFDVNNVKMKPLIYIPQSFSYLITETSQLALASQIPGFSPLADALVFQHINKNIQLDSLIKPDRTQNLVIQAKCLNCNENKDINIISSSPPRIMPSNPFYFIIEFIDRQKMSKHSLPSERIDFILGTMSKEVSALNVVIQNPKNNGTVIYLLEKWRDNIENIQENYLNINTKSQKEEYSRRINLYFWHILVNSRRWRDLQPTELVVNELDQFERLVSDYVQSLDIIPEPPATSYGVGNKKYKVDAPHSGSYKFVIYNYKPNDGDVVSAFVNEDAYEFKKADPHDKWYFSRPIKLDKGEQTVIMPELTKRETSYPGFKVEESLGTSECKQIDFGKIDPKIDYSIEFEYLTTSVGLVKTRLLEKNSQFPNGKEKSIYPKIDTSTLNPFLYNANIKYVPSEFAEDATLGFCIEKKYDLPTTLEIKNLKVIETYSNYLVFLTEEKPPILSADYNLQFVALNQTAYLVLISGAPDQFMIGLNSRFDQQWGLNKVDINLAKQYFKGKRKQYLNGSVIEYQKQDKHILSGLIFPGGNPQKPDIQLNAFSNGWVVDSEGGKEMAFLIEYIPQSTFYKTTAISLISLLGFGIIYLLFIRFRK